jgi:hypothetical protein
MADLDKVVRPFQLRPQASALPEKVLEVRKPGMPVTLRIGGSGKGKQVSGHVSGSVTLFHTEEVEEQATDH